ncbi:hypothetical protein ScPMuIL_005656 [Solemya velum]
MCRCAKRQVTLVWAVLECLFFTGIVCGWTWMAQILKYDGYFLDKCNITDISFMHTYTVGELTDTGPLLERKVDVKGPRRKCYPRKKKGNEKLLPLNDLKPPSDFLRQSFNLSDVFCDDQEDSFDLMINLVLLIRNVLALPFGIFLDIYGTTRTRLLAVLTFIVGTLMMTFSNRAFPWLVVPALGVLGAAGSWILMTNIQISNLFGTKRHTVMSLFIGAFHSSAVIMICMKFTHYEGINMQTSFMFLTIGVVPILVSTIAFLPKSRIPWPLPADYGKSHFTPTNRATLKMQRAWQRRISAGGKTHRETPDFRPIACTSLYVWSVVWFCIAYLRACAFDGNIKPLLQTTGADKDTVNLYSVVYSLSQLLALPLSPLLGIIMDWKRRKCIDTDPKVRQMQNILLALTVTFVLSLTSTMLSMIPVLGLQMLTFLVQIAERVAMLATTLAFVTHVHFPGEHFGKLIGIHLAASSLFGLAQFLFESFIEGPLNGDPFYVNLLLLILILVSSGHPINVWYHCRLGLVNDLSSPDHRKTVTVRLVDVTQSGNSCNIAHDEQSDVHMLDDSVAREETDTMV